MVSAHMMVSMITLSETTQQTRARPDAVFALWADVDHWAEYDDGIEWARLADDFRVGGRLTIKPRGVPRTKAEILIVEANRRFVNSSHLLGAKLRFDHTVVNQDNVTIVSVVVTLSGPLSFLWARLVGKGQQADIEKSTARLIARAEQES